MICVNSVTYMLHYYIYIIIVTSSELLCIFHAHTKLYELLIIIRMSSFTLSRFIHTDGPPSLSDKCPKIREGSFGACSFICSDDDDCQLGQICCSNGCGRDCICPPDQPLAKCFAAPCKVATCPAHPDATCREEYCGGCIARFFDSNGNEVTDTCSKPF